MAAATVAFAYVGSVSAHTDPDLYDPSIYNYLDGNSGTDQWAMPVRWAGAADNSITEVVPKLAAGWLNGSNYDDYNLHVLESSRMEWTTNPTGRIGGLVRVSPGGTGGVVRTIGMPVDGFNYLSGEVTIALRPTASVVVQVFGAPTAIAVGHLLASVPMPPQHPPVGLVAHWLDVPISDPFAYVQLVYTETGDTQGYPAQVDHLSMLPTVNPLGEDYPGYFDGNTSDGMWTGGKGTSASTYFGGSRRCLAEVIEAIDMTSMAGGTRAEFAVAMVIPGAFWEDPQPNNFSLTLSNANLLAGYDVYLDQLDGGTAPIADAVLTIAITGGSLTDLTITDDATNAWLKISGALPTTGTIVIDNGAFTVKAVDTNGNATSLITNVTRGGSNQLLPLTPYLTTRLDELGNTVPSSCPVLNFDAGSGSGGLSVTVQARRRYMIG